jgi:hypothetical protein
MQENYQGFIATGEDIFRRIDRRNTHLQQKYSLIDVDLTQKLMEDLHKLYENLPTIDNTQSIENVEIIELKRKCSGHIELLNEELSSAIPTPDQVISVYNIKNEDIDKIKDWLLLNKQNVIDANRNQYDYYSAHKRSYLVVGSPEIRQQAESIVQEKIEIMKGIVTELFINYKGISELTSDYLLSVDSSTSRSHSNHVSKLAVICPPAVTYMFNGKIYFVPEEFIRIFGHEVLGHCLSFILTAHADLPFYLTEDYSSLTTASQESVANYFQNKIFEYLLDNPAQTSLLRIDEPFENVYKRYVDTVVLNKYSLKLRMVGYWILAHSKMDQYKAQVDELMKYSIEPSWPSYFVNLFRNDWNRGTGLLLPKQVSELRYSVDAVGDIKQQVSSARLQRMEELILTGCWTSDGLKDWVQVKIDNAIK